MMDKGVRVRFAKQARVEARQNYAFINSHVIATSCVCVFSPPPPLSLNQRKVVNEQ